MSEELVYSQLKQLLDKHKRINKVKWKNIFTEVDLIDELDHLEVTYELYAEKLEMVPKVKNLALERQQGYYKIMMLIANMGSFPEEVRMKMMLSWGVLINYFSKINQLSNEQLVMISACTMEVYVDDYTFYAGILSDKRVVDAITTKGNDLKQQVKISLAIMDSMDKLEYSELTKENFEIIINNAFNVINAYTLPEENVKGHSR